MSVLWGMLPAQRPRRSHAPSQSQKRRRTIGARIGGLAMATVTYYEQSFLVPFWQNIIDFNAALIAVPLGTVSGSLSGFAFENVDGTYTVFLGADLVVGASAPISGTVTEIVRRSSLGASGTPYVYITVSFSATSVYEAYRGGGDEFFASVFSGGDTVDILSPASLGALAQSPLIETYGGDDVVSGSIHDDTIYAGWGADHVHGDRGHDTIYGGGGEDELYGGRGRDRIFGGDGDDVIHGGNGLIAEVGADPDDGADEIHGGDGTDTIHGDGGDDTIYGEYGSDRLFGDNGRDDIFGGDGGDDIEGGAGGDNIYGGRGADTIYGDRHTETGDDTVYGQDGNDTIYGGRGDDELHGDDGNDVILGEDGRDDIEGGAGADIIY